MRVAASLWNNNNFEFLGNLMPDLERAEFVGSNFSKRFRFTDASRQNLGFPKGNRVII